MKAHFAYLRKVMRHKWFVFLECCKLGIPWLGIVHDWSKFLPSEWAPYVFTFCGKWEYDERPRWLKDAFDLAWNHHQKCNKHHWQYWMLTNDSDEPQTNILPMPDRYRREMLADWRGAGRAYGNPNTCRWYEQHRHRIMIHADTRTWIEEQLAPEIPECHQD